MEKAESRMLAGMHVHTGQAHRCVAQFVSHDWELTLFVREVNNPDEQGVELVGPGGVIYARTTVLKGWDEQEML